MKEGFGIKLKFKQNKLMENLNYAIRGISNKNLIPILGCIKFDLKEEGLYLLSTNNEFAIKCLIDKKDIVEIIELGEIVISGRYIYDIVKKLSNEIITIEEVVDSQVLITTTNSSFKLNCNKSNEFPNIELEYTKNPIMLVKNEFKNMINQIIFSTSTQESRPILTGINFKISKKVMECTATDSYRLSKKTILLNDDVDSEINIVVPSKNLVETTKMLIEDDEKLELHIFGNKIIFKCNNIIIMSRLINGNYPATDKLIPKDYALTIKVKLDDFYNAIDRASLLTNEEEKNIINLFIDSNKAKITSNIPEIGNVEENINVLNKDNKNLNISFSSKFMMEAIKVFNSEDIELCFNGEIKPIIIKNVDNSDLIQLILPIRTY